MREREYTRESGVRLEERSATECQTRVVIKQVITYSRLGSPAPPAAPPPTSDRASARPQPNHTRAHHFLFQFGGFVATVNSRNHFALYRTLLETGHVTIDPKRGISAIGQELAERWADRNRFRLLLGVVISVACYTPLYRLRGTATRSVRSRS